MDARPSTSEQHGQTHLYTWLWLAPSCAFDRFLLNLTQDFVHERTRLGVYGKGTTFLHLRD